MLSQMVKNIVIADGHTHFFLIQSTTEGHLGCFQVLAIMNEAVMNISMQGFMWT